MSSMRWRVNRHEGHHPLLQADDPHRPESLAGRLGEKFEQRDEFSFIGIGHFVFLGTVELFYDWNRTSA